ncbi:hypothetical protein LA345_23365 [Burkholderia vietnamiensis]|nr:hypothetical protein [Burkholderia vietnamiensis]
MESTTQEYVLKIFSLCNDIALVLNAKDAKINYTFEEQTHHFELSQDGYMIASFVDSDLEELEGQAHLKLHNILFNRDSEE